MPYNRPGNIFYTNNGSGGALTHGQPTNSEGRVGVAIKQKALPWAQGLTGQDSIASLEDYAILVKGIVEVAEVSGFAVGDPVYMIAATNVLTETVGTNLKFGRVVEIEGERGTPTNKVRIDLDAKDSF